MTKFIVESPSNLEEKQVLIHFPEEDHRRVKIFSAASGLSIRRYAEEAVSVAIATGLEENEHLRGMVEHMLAYKGSELIVNEAGDFVVRDATEKITT